MAAISPGPGQDAMPRSARKRLFACPHLRLLRDMDDPDGRWVCAECDMAFRLVKEDA